MYTTVHIAAAPGVPVERVAEAGRMDPWAEQRVSARAPPFILAGFVSIKT